MQIWSEAASLVEPIAKSNPTSATSAYHLANILEYQGNRLEALGQSAVAIQRYRASLELVRPFLNMENGSATGQSIAAEEDLAQVLASTGDHAAALDFANLAVAQAEKRASTSPPSERYAGGLARAYATLATVQENAGDPFQARKSAEKALETWKQVHSRGVISVHGGIMADNEKLLARLSAASPPGE